MGGNINNNHRDNYNVLSKRNTILLIPFIIISFIAFFTGFLFGQQAFNPELALMIEKNIFKWCEDNQELCLEMYEKKILNDYVKPEGDKNVLDTPFSPITAT